METTTRHPQVEEIPALKQIWKTAFGSGDEKIFFSRYFDPKLCIVATHADAPAAAGYIIPTGKFVAGLLAAPCAMIYAVATLPEYRNRGFGMAVVRELIITARNADYPIIALCPSDDSLFEYYGSRSELHDFFYITERKYKNLPADTAKSKLTPIQAAEYSRIRKTLLKCVSHIEPDLRALSYQVALCREYGGGLFSVDTQNGVSCAVIEKDSAGTILIKELLSPEGCENAALSAISAAFPSEEYIVRTPALYQNHPPEAHADITADARRFGMLSAPAALIKNINLQTPPTTPNSQLPTPNYPLSTPNSQLTPRLLTSNPYPLSPVPWLGLAFD